MAPVSDGVARTSHLDAKALSDMAGSCRMCASLAMFGCVETKSDSEVALHPATQVRHDCRGHPDPAVVFVVPNVDLVVAPEAHEELVTVASIREKTKPSNGM